MGRIIIPVRITNPNNLVSNFLIENSSGNDFSSILVETIIILIIRINNGQLSIDDIYKIDKNKPININDFQKVVSIPAPNNDKINVETVNKKSSLQDIV